jgi:hypothetical protein
LNSDQLGFTLLLVAALLGLAGYFGRQQLKTLRGLAPPNVLGAEDRGYLRSQAYRRLFCSLLMVVIAGLLVGWLYLDAEQRQLEKEARVVNADPEAPPTPEQKEFFHVFRIYTVAALLVLLMLLVLATMDFWATARYGLSQHRKLQADRRTLLEEQAARRRQERNGQSGS